MPSSRVLLQQSTHIRHVVKSVCMSSRTTPERLPGRDVLDESLEPDRSNMPHTNPGNGQSPVISVSRHQLVRYILDHILYQDDHILAFNKPNGLPILVPKSNLFGSSVIYLDGKTSETTRVMDTVMDGVCEDGEITQYDRNRHKAPGRPYETSLSLQDILPDLQEQVKSSDMEIGMTLPRLYSGIVVLTKSNEAQKKLKKYLETARSQKLHYQSFSCLTVGIPTRPETGTETVACRLAEIDGRSLTVPTDNVSVNCLKKGLAVRLEVQLQTVAENRQLGCALLEIKPTRDKWDVLEWYCTRRLCSVLGDHVYSPRVGSVLGIPTHVEPHVALPKTQDVPKQMLKNLGVKKDYVSSLPLHVHRGSVRLDGFPSKTSDPIMISAPLPEFFRYNCDLLHLNGDR